MGEVGAVRSVGLLGALRSAAPVGLLAAVSVGFAIGAGACGEQLTDFTDSEGGAGGGGAGGEDACSVVETIPAVGGDGVAISGELHVTYSMPLDATSLDGSVKLQLLGAGEEVPAEVKVDAATGSDVVIRPKHSLRFWGSYALSISGVRSLRGDACSSATIAFSTIQPEALPRPLRAAPVTGVALAGGHAIAASAGYRGFQTYDVDGAVHLVSDHTTAYSPANIVVSGQRAYVPAGFAGVRVLDVSDPAAPEEIGYGATPGSANDVAVIEKGGRTFLIVADVEGGARVLDATDPAAVADLGELDLGPGERAVVQVDALGDRVALAEGERAVLLDLPDPSDLASQITLAEIDAGTLASDVLLGDGALFVGRGALGVASYSLANPAAPALVASAPAPQAACGPGCGSFASHLVRFSGDLFVAYGRAGIVRYSIGAGGALTAVTTYGVEGDVRSLAVNEARVLGGGEEGLVVFARQGDGSTPLWAPTDLHGRARAVRVRQGFAYVPSHLAGLVTYSLLDPEAPDPVDRDATPASLAADEAAVAVSSSGGVLAVADGREGVALFDLTSPDDPALTGALGTTDTARAVASAGGVVYACNDNDGVVIVDASDPAAPALLASAKLDDVAGTDACRDLAPAGGVLYVARASGLGVLDVADPAAPAWTDLVPLPAGEWITAVRTAGAHLLVSAVRADPERPGGMTGRLHVFDRVDPLSPALVWSSASLASAVGLTVAGDVAFVSAASDGVLVFDVSDPAAPVLEGAIATPGDVTFVARGDGVLYAAQGAGGLQAIRTGPLPGKE